MRTLASGCTLLLLAATAAGAQPAPTMAGYDRHPNAWLLLKNLEADYDFSEAELDEVEQSLAVAQRMAKLVEFEQKAKEKTLDWNAYRAIHVNEANVARGVEFLNSHRDLLARAEADFGLPPTVVAGILGVETKFGIFANPHRVLDALATQGFEHPTRSAFFFSELTEFFALCRELGFHPPAVMGSYAGAMGFAQFMPSNYRRLALDFDGNGLTDLWAMPDAIGSIANYLVRYGGDAGYRRGAPLIVPARLGKGVPAAVPVNPRKPTHTYADFGKLGITAAIELPPGEAVGLIELPLADGGREYWIGLHNFFAVMTYNPRTFYAMSVAQLAGTLQQAADAAR
jgi:membrane-bound lytic murein transglycosylase B